MSTPRPNPDRRTPPEQGWHLDKKVPLSLILAMIVQVAMVIMAIADIKKDVEVLKAQVLVPVIDFLFRPWMTEHCRKSWVWQRHLYE